RSVRRRPKAHLRHDEEAMGRTPEEGCQEVVKCSANSASSFAQGMTRFVICEVSRPFLYLSLDAKRHTKSIDKPEVPSAHLPSQSGARLSPELHLHLCTSVFH